jgi:hypothetical protein
MVPELQAMQQSSWPKLNEAYRCGCRSRSQSLLRGAAVD